MRKPQTIGIRGAGLAGLSVARELLRVDPGLQISLFDIRPRLPHPQRTFCFFQSDDRILGDIPNYSWRAVKFRGPSFERLVDVSSSPYTMMRGDDFFGCTLKRLEAHGVTFRWSCSEIVVESNSLRVAGEVLPFDVVIDAAFDPRSADSMMWQSFAGVWVTTESPSFDPSTAVLMDLQESSAEAPVSFLYILPTSRHTALLEHTTFSPTPMSKEYHLARCFSWLGERDVGIVQRGECEHGLIPMGLRRSDDSAAITVGSIAGTVRPATGYAFLATQEHARGIAQQVLDHTRAHAPVYPWWLRVADTLFLQALLGSPERGGELLARLLARTRPDALIPFLAGKITFSDALSVWLSVPKISMVRALLRV